MLKQAKTMRKVEDVEVEGHQYREVKINVRDMSAVFNEIDQELSLMIPTIRMDYPIITEEANREFSRAGLNEIEIDDALSNMMDELQKRIITKILFERMI